MNVVDAVEVFVFRVPAERGLPHACEQHARWQHEASSTKKGGQMFGGHVIGGPTGVEVGSVDTQEPVSVLLEDVQDGPEAVDVPNLR